MTFNNEHDYLQIINTFQAEVYPKVKEMVESQKVRRIEAANMDRQEPDPAQVDNTIFRRENRRDKLTPWFSKHKVLDDNALTLTTTKPQKIHIVMLQAYKDIVDGIERTFEEIVEESGTRNLVRDTDVIFSITFFFI